ncbi:MAG: hypothetical protein QOG67_2149 [Verrucomicrobiota bacterium]
MDASGGYILETERLILREYAEDDVEAFYRLNSDPEVMRYTGDDMLSDIDHAREILLAHPITDYRKHGFGRWACLLKSDGQKIGFAGLKYLEERKEVDLGYRLLPAYWGQGFATEASGAVIRYGFDQLGLHRVIGLARPENTASVRVLEKVGMRFVNMTQHRSWMMARYVIDCETEASEPAAGTLAGTW